MKGRKGAGKGWRGSKERIEQGRRREGERERLIKKTEKKKKSDRKRKK
jgi:hypothetical protein